MWKLDWVSTQLKKNINQKYRSRPQVFITYVENGRINNVIGRC